MTTTDERRADATLRHDVATTLQRLADAVRSGNVKRWQLVNVGPSIRMIEHVLTKPQAPLRETAGEATYRDGEV